jgi:hypothetical protein
MPTADPRLAGLAAQLAVIHDGLREQLAAVQDGLAATRTGTGLVALQDHCLAFCGALGAHHEQEDGTGFGLLAELAPATRPAIEQLRQDHRVVAGLLRELEQLLAGDRPVEEVGRAVEGLAAIIESHFRHEERTLNAALAGTLA